jgi:transketolase
MASTAELAEIARQCRVDTIKELRAAQSGHPGSSLSAMDVMVALYFGGFLRHRAEEPDWPDRDHFLMSAGHAVPGLYSVLTHAGYADPKVLKGLRSLGTGLEGHAKRGTFPGVEASSGSLGQGLNLGIGLAIGLRHAGRPGRVFVLQSDGEQEEGAVWEGAMSAVKWNLSHLVTIVDKNENQINGPTRVIMPSLDPLPEKYESFGWATREIKGNDMDDVVAGLEWAAGQSGPSALISHTETGHPISYMRGDYHWHHGVINDELFLQAMAELNEPVSPTPDDTWLPGHTGEPAGVA